MDEKQNYDRFDLDNDYEGGEWIGDEYFYRNKKQKFQQSAEDRLYGVFADSDSEGEGRGKKKSRKPADFSKPVGFVSSGVTVNTTQKPEDVLKSEHQTMPATGAGLGSGAGLGAAGGLGFKSQQPAADENMEEEQESLLPTAFGQRYVRLQACLFCASLQLLLVTRVRCMHIQGTLSCMRSTPGGLPAMQDHAVSCSTCSSTSSTAAKGSCQNQA